MTRLCMLVVAALLVESGLQRLPADEPKSTPQPPAKEPQLRGTPIPREVADEWSKKIGGRVTWSGIAPDGRWTTTDTLEGLTDPIPYFGFPYPPRAPIEWDKLPDPKVPFGIQLGRFPITDATIDQLKRFKTLAVVDLRGTAVTDKGLEALAELKGIVRLGCSEHTTPAGLKHLKTFSALRSVSLNGRKVTDDALKELAEVEGLTDLDLSSSAITNEGLKHLKALKRLRALNLVDTNITGEGLGHLGALPALTALAVGAHGDRPLELGNLVELPGLTSLKLSAVSSRLRTLPQLKTVTALQLSGDVFGAEDLACLLKLPALASLTVGVNNITGAGLKQLSGLQHLTSLILAAQLTDAQLEPLKDCVRLRELLVTDTLMTDAGLVHLAALPDLEVLTIDCARVTADGMKHVAKMKSLRKLRLILTRVTPAGFEHLAQLEKLTWLSIAMSDPPIGDDGLENVKKLKRVTNMYFEECFITDAGLKHFEEMKDLKELRIKTALGSVSAPAVKKLREALPNCKINE